MTAKVATAKVVTANRLSEGRVVYLDGNGDWSASLGNAACAADDAASDALRVQAERAGRVVGPYLIDVVEIDGAIEPLGTREMIRAAGGPTVIPPGLDNAAHSERSPDVPIR